MSEITIQLSAQAEEEEEEDISLFGKRVYLPDYVLFLRKKGYSWKKAKMIAQKQIASVLDNPSFLGFERTSEIFISKYKTGTWRDEKAKRCWVKHNDFWISHVNFKGI